jgi:hypothetical protein
MMVPKMDNILAEFDGPANPDQWRAWLGSTSSKGIENLHPRLLKIPDIARGNCEAMQERRSCTGGDGRAGEWVPSAGTVPHCQ